MLTDWELLDRFAATRDQPAFAELVSRHVDVVYGIARRVLGGPGQEAQDVTQAVFLLLSQKARSIPRRGALSGWLFKATRYCCANTRKSEGRRKRHEQGAAMLRQESIETSEDLQPILDQGLAKLSEKERQAILVRYFEKKTAAVAGETLGISPEAVEKRLERGIARLRQFFSAQGYNVPVASVAAILIAEQAKAAPASLAATIGSGTHAGLQVAAIAKGASMKMFWAKVTTSLLTGSAIVAAPLVGAAVITIATSNPSIPPPPPATIAATSPVSPASGPVRFVRWEVLMTKDGADRVKKVLTSVPSASKGYEAYIGDAEKFRLLVRDGKTGTDMLDLSDELKWGNLEKFRGIATPEIILAAVQANLNAQVGPQWGVTIFGGFIHGNVFAEPVENAVHLRIESTADAIIQVVSNNNGKADSITKSMQLHYAGDVPVGQAVVFLGNLAEINGIQLWQASVWQTIRCDDAEWAFVSKNSAAQWVDLGPDQEHLLAEQAIAWNSRAKQRLGKVTPKWERKLPNGGILRLIAVGLPNHWLDCWWDADGKPVVVAPTNWGRSIFWREPPLPIAVLVQANDSNLPQNDSWSMSTSHVANARVSVGVAAGPWIAGQRIQVGQTLKIRGGTVTLKNVTEQVMNPTDTSLYIFGECDRPADTDVKIGAFNKDDKELSPNKLRPDDAPRTHFDDGKSPSNGEKFQALVPGQMSDVAYFAVQSRTISYTEFTDFSTTPTISPESINPSTQPLVAP